MAKNAAKSKKREAPKDKAAPQVEPAKDEAKGQAESGSAPSAAESAAPAPIDLTKPKIKKAIEDGLAVIKAKQSKAEAAWAIYEQIKDEDKDLIVAAFVKGATLTEKGALTYWYNCRKRAAKEDKAPAK